MRKPVFLQGVWRFSRSQAEGVYVTSPHKSPGHWVQWASLVGSASQVFSQSVAGGTKPILHGSPGRGQLTFTPGFPWTLPLCLFLPHTWLCIPHRKEPQPWDNCVWRPVNSPGEPRQLGGRGAWRPSPAKHNNFTNVCRKEKFQKQMARHLSR